MSDAELTKFKILRDVDRERLPVRAAAGVLGLSAGCTHRSAPIWPRSTCSALILDETERAIADIITDKGLPDGAQHAARARAHMERAFAEAKVQDFEPLLGRAAACPTQATLTSSQRR